MLLRDAAELFPEDPSALLLNPASGQIGAAQLQPQRALRRAVGVPDWDGRTRFARVHVLATPNRQETLEYLALGRRALEPDGRLYFSAENALGADGYRKRLPPLELVSRRKCKCSLYSEAELPLSGDPRELRQPFPEADFLSCPGLFSWDRLDAGTRRLIGQLPATLPGDGADFGCGPGLLARALMAHGPERLDAIDVDRRAVEACAANLQDARLRPLWLDLTEESPDRSYDWITLNPPFHGSGREQRGLGLSLLRRALHHLKPKGTLWLVANQDLPYETAVQEWGATFQTLERAGGYKVLRCRRNG